MIRYFDASALVKRYVQESGTAAVARLLDTSTPVTCRLSEAEIASALARRRRDGDLSATAHRSALAMLRADLARLSVVELTPSVFASSQLLLARHALRAGDALHLAAALTLRDGLGEELDFVCFDRALGAAARDEGMRILP